MVIIKFNRACTVAQKTAQPGGESPRRHPQHSPKKGESFTDRERTLATKLENSLQNKKLQYFANCSRKVIIKLPSVCQ